MAIPDQPVCGKQFFGHHWELTSVRIDGKPFTHYRCVRCAAEKDVPVEWHGTGHPVPASRRKKKEVPS
jgi:hypothetical protein